MLSWVRKGLGTGILTTHYPRKPEQMPEAFRGRPLLDVARCQAAQGCAACVEVCLPGALRLLPSEAGEAPRLVLDYGRCIQCGLCVSNCPAQALSMTNEYELATTAQEDLRITVHLDGRSDQQQQEERS